MQSMHPHVEMVLDSYLAYSKGHLEDALSVLDREVEIEADDSTTAQRSFRGHRARAFFRRLQSVTSASVEPESCEALGDEVVVRGRFRGRVRNTGRQFDVAVTHVWTIRDGRARRIAVYTGKAKPRA